MRLAKADCAVDTVGGMLWRDKIVREMQWQIPRTSWKLPTVLCYQPTEYLATVSSVERKACVRVILVTNLFNDDESNSVATNFSSTAVVNFVG